MTPAEAFLGADSELLRVIEQIPDDKWGMKLPEWFQLGRNHDRGKLTLRDLINYHAYDEAWVPDTLAGEKVDGRYDGDLLGNDPKSVYRDLAAKAKTAVENLAAPDKVVHLTYGDYPAHEYLTHTGSWRFFRAIDYSRLLGINDTMPQNLVQAWWGLLRPDIEDWRNMGVFQTEIPVPEDAPLQQRLLGLVGRPPTH